MIMTKKMFFMNYSTRFYVLFILSFILGLSALKGQAGVMDCDFGTGGVVTTPFTSGTEDTAYDLVVYENQASGAYSGKIVVVGTDEDGSGDDNFAIARYNEDGTLDGSFGNSGKVTIDFGYNFERAYGVAIQPDGKIIVTGNSGNPSSCAIARLQPDGSLDTSFSGNGKNRTQEGYWNDVVVDSQGSIFVSGSGSNTSNVLKFSSDGSFLNNFSFDLTPGTDCCEGFNSLAVDNNDRIIVVGGSQQATRDMSVIRMNSNGTLDSSFDGDGKKFIDFNGDWDVAGSVAINADGKIVVAGEAPDGDFGIAMLNLDGSFDTGFNGGKVSVDLDGGSSDQSNSGVFFQDDGKVIAGCYSSGLYGMVRYNSDGTLDNTFGDNGKITHYTGVDGGDYPQSFYRAPNGDFLGCGIAWVQSGDDGKDFGIISVRTQSEDMVYSSTTALQQTGVISPATQGGVIAVKIDVCGDLNPHNVTQIDFNTNGTTDPSDIEDAKIFYTGTSDSFAPTNQFGSTINSPNGDVSLTGSQHLTHGTNYFWISYTIKSSASQGNVVDAECPGLTLDGGVGAVIPDVTNPSGSREIKNVLFEEDFGMDESPLPGDWMVQDIDGDGLNWTTTNDAWGAPNGRSGGGVRSASYEDTETAPVDNRLISPEIDLTGYSAATLSFYMASIDDQNSGYENEYVEVYITTNWDGSSDFPTTDLLGAIDINSGDWIQHTNNIDTYTGETVHLCWRHKMDDVSQSWAVRMDDVLLTGVPEAEPGISVIQETNTIANGGSFDFGSSKTGTHNDVTLTIENNGLADLDLTGNPIVSISGDDADQFSVQLQPESPISAGTSSDFSVQFSPSSAGEKTAMVSIDNNSETNPYSFAVTGTGMTEPVVTTEETTDIGEDSATSHGSIAEVGYPDVSEYGHVWNTTGNPNINDSKSQLGASSNTGSFTTSMENLIPGTTYFVRAYATNDAGTSYGDEVSFETLKKTVTVTGSFVAADKEYDGTANATIAENNLTLSGMLDGDDLALSNVVAEFVSSAVSENVEVEIISAELTGGDKDKYELSLSGAPTSEASILEPKYVATIVVKDNNDDMLENAEVSIAGEILYTDVSGTVSLELEDGVYPFTVSQGGFEQYSGELTVNGSDTQVEVVITVTQIRNNAEKKVLFYPVPCSEVLYVNGNNEISSISFFDVSGQVAGIISDPSGEIDTSHLSTGFYLVKVVFKDGMVEIKRIIVRE